MENEFIQFLQTTSIRAWSELRFAVAVFTVGMLIQLVSPAQRGQPVRDVLFNLAYTLIFILVSGTLMLSTSWIIDPVVAWAGGPLLHLEFGDSFFAQFAYGLCFLAIFDFFYYWFHRLQHQSDFLWAQHKFHHSDESLNVTTTYRHHWLENWLRIFLILIPMQFIIALKPGTVGMVWTAFILLAYFIHMNLRLNLGPLTGVVAGPQLHRIHHSNRLEHQDRNYAAVFPVYDIIFGTYFRPSPDEYPETGLVSGQKMNTMMEANFGVFRDWWSLLRGRRQKA